MCNLRARRTVTPRKFSLKSEWERWWCFRWEFCPEGVSPLPHCAPHAPYAASRSFLNHDARDSFTAASTFKHEPTEGGGCPFMTSKQKGKMGVGSRNSLNLLKHSLDFAVKEGGLWIYSKICGRHIRKPPTPLAVYTHTKCLSHAAQKGKSCQPLNGRGRRTIRGSTVPSNPLDIG